tara:strand:+ start:13 stop:255 length:243 start_codon:yes stop_codon:yes gene_type:complete
MNAKLILSLGATAILYVVSLFSVYNSGYDNGYGHKEHELKECAEEVSNGCPNVTTYAVMLEKENARLNKMCKIKPQRAAD